MDPITAQKLRARKSYKRRSNCNFQFFYNLILQLLTALACALLTSNSYWLPSVKRFLFISLPSMSSNILSPRCLFVVVNIIVVTLIGQSKLGGLTMKQSPSRDIYDEYVKRSQSGVRRSPVMTSIGKEVGVGKEVHEEKTMVETSEDVEEVGFKRPQTECLKEKGQEEEEEEQQQQQEVEEEEEQQQQQQQEVEEEEEELPNEELNRRAEEFIARVNRQRWLEARALMNFPTQHVGRSIAVHG